MRPRIAEYWPSSFFACLWVETKARSRLEKKNKANIQTSWPHTWSIKDLLPIVTMVFEEVVLAGHGGKSLAGNIARSGSQSHFTAQDSVHLARSLS